MEMSLVVVKHHDIKQNFDIHQIFKLASKIKQFIKVIAGGKYTNSETQKNSANSAYQSLENTLQQTVQSPYY